jgi:hypothetical protein
LQNILEDLLTSSRLDFEGLIKIHTAKRIFVGDRPRTRQDVSLFSGSTESKRDARVVLYSSNWQNQVAEKSCSNL